MIADIVNNEVKTIVSESSRWDDAKFLVSTLINPVEKDNKNTGSHKIVLTVERNGITNSRVIFPKANLLDYLSLEEEMHYLYNSTT